MWHKRAGGFSVFLFVLGVWMLWPLLALSSAWWQATAEAWDVLWQMWQTVLPDYIATSVQLALAVGLGVALCGGITAALVVWFEFPGRRYWEWALLLPLAMPAYVVAYAYTDFLQVAGPLQNGLRELLQLRGRVLPDVRQWGGAVWVFTFTLYPYVYLLVRTALREHSAHLMDAARLLGASWWRRVHQVALPLARPSLMAGVALVLMETLADYGVSSYFGIQTFSTGIYKAWLVMDNRVAAAQLATGLLGVVAILLWLERRAQQHMRFVQGRHPHGSVLGADERIHLSGWRAGLASALAAFPVLTGFVAPVLFMLWPLWAGWEQVIWPSFWQWSLNSAGLAAVSAVLALCLAWVLGFVQRCHATTLSRAVTQAIGLGYALPGAVLVVGLLLPVAWLQTTWPEIGLTHAMTGTVFGLLWAYLVRFTAVAWQSIHSGYARLPTALDESAQMLGVTGWRAWRQLHLPLLQRSSVAAFLLVFVDVVKELPATLVLRPFGYDTLAVVTYQLARDERLGEAALPALTLVLVGLLPVGLLMRSLRVERQLL